MRVVFADMFQDLRYSFRGLRKNPLYTAIAVLSLSLGIGANVAVFSLANAVLFRPLAVPEPDQLIALYNRNVNEPGQYSSNSWPDFRYFREHTQTLEGLAVYVRAPFPVRLGEDAERISGELVSAGYFQVLGVQAALGRVFLEGEGQTPASSSVAVLSDSFWRKRFGADPSVAGRTIHVGTRIFTIVGVLPRDFRSVLLDWGEPPDLWIPLAAYREAVPIFANVEPEENRGMHWLMLAGRLKTGHTAVEAQAEIGTLSRQLPPPQGETAQWEPFVVPLQQARFWVGNRESVILILASLAAIAGLVLLIALLNLGNLTLARTAAREKEFGMRLALGAGRGRLIRLLVTDNMLLSALASIGSAAVAFWMVRLLLSFDRPFAFQTSFDTRPDLRVIGFGVLLLFASGSLLALLAARPLWRLDVNDALKNTAGGPVSRFDLRHALIIAQVALSTVLVAATGQFVRTLENARSDGRTPDAGNVLLCRLDLALPGYEAEEGRMALTRMLQHVRSIAGVRSAGLVWIVPLSGTRGGTDVIIDTQKVQVEVNVISPSYFETAGVPILRGRDFSPADRADSPGMAIVNQRMAERFWRGQEATGKRFRLASSGEEIEIIGVVPDRNLRRIRVEAQPCIYRPVSQEYRREMHLQVRTAGSPLEMMSAVRSELRQVDRNVPALGFQTMETHLDTALAQERMTATLGAILGSIAVVLVSIGLYGLVSFDVVRRTREIGIRMALGARSGQVLRMVLGQAARLALIGVATGIPLLLAFSQLISSLLYRVSPTDVASFAAAACLVASGVAAGFLPAYRASRVDPGRALKSE